MIDLIDLSKLPDWRTHAGYRQQERRLSVVSAALPQLETRREHAEAAVSAAQAILDETETRQLANRAKPRDVEHARAALDKAQAEYDRVEAAYAASEREHRLLTNGLEMLREDAQAEVAAQLSDAALASTERVELALAEAVAALEAHHALATHIMAQFPGAPIDTTYARGLGMVDWPFSDLRNARSDRGALVETTYSHWCTAVRKWKAQRKQLAQARRTSVDAVTSA